jgi:hypothetical protein
MEELRRERTRAADDYLTIRARLEELRRERAQLADRSRASPAMRRAVITVRRA